MEREALWLQMAELGLIVDGPSSTNISRSQFSNAYARKRWLKVGVAIGTRSRASGTLVG
jgi:hypothetical protein